MSKTESDPHSISFNNLIIDIAFESPLWQESDNLKPFIYSIVVSSLNALKITNINTKIELSILLADDEKLQELNKQFRNKDKPTNVLSFPRYEITSKNYLQTLSNENQIYLGDIALSYTTIYNESIEQDKLFLHHLAHMLVHGILHLVGYEHEVDTEADKMESLEIEILEKVNIPNPY